MKQAKFFRMLLSVDEQFMTQDEKSLEIEDKGGNNEQSLQMYRQLLNDFLRLVIKLNNGADQLSKQSEVYKLKLFNNELREDLAKAHSEMKSNRIQS